MGTTQLNIPRDFFYGDIEAEIPQPIRIGRGAGDEARSTKPLAYWLKRSFR